MSKKLGVTIGFLSGLGFFLGWYSLTYMMMFTVVILLVAGEEEILKKNVLNAYLVFIQMKKGTAQEFQMNIVLEVTQTNVPHAKQVIM